MGYKSLEHCLQDLESTGQLIRIKEQVDPYLEMAAIHLRVFEAEGPALLFENVKGSKFRAASNIFGIYLRQGYKSTPIHFPVLYLWYIRYFNFFK